MSALDDAIAGLQRCVQAAERECARRIALSSDRDSLQPEDMLDANARPILMDGYAALVNGLAAHELAAAMREAKP